MKKLVGKFSRNAEGVALFKVRNQSGWLEHEWERFGLLEAGERR